MNILTLQSNLLLGECPIFDKLSNGVLLVDIEDKKIISIINSEVKKYNVPFTPGFISYNKKNELVCGADSSIYKIFFKNNIIEYKRIFSIEQEKNNRINDGKYDSFGNLWFTTMDTLQKNKTGKLFMLTPEFSLHQMLDGFIIGNGMDWSQCKQFIYFTDSTERKVYKFKINYIKVRLLQKKIFANILCNEGYPDGLIVDSNNNIYSAHWDGSIISVYNSEGIRFRTINLPCSRPTSMCFVNNDENQLFVTSAVSEISNSKYDGQVFFVTN